MPHIASRGRLSRPLNGGVTWTQQKSGNWGGSWGPYAVAFADAKCGWLLTGASMDANGNYQNDDANIILATTDGGATWEHQHSRTGIELSDIACAGSPHAWAVGSDPSDSGSRASSSPPAMAVCTGRNST